MIQEFALICCLNVALVVAAPAFVAPQHVHLSYGETDDQMVVTWTTFTNCESKVEFGTSDLSMSAVGNTTTFDDKADTKRIWYIHRVTLANLTPGVKYYYHCGSELAWSDLFYFTSKRTDINYTPWIALYGDMGSVNGKSIPRLQEEIMRSTLDVILHVGDFAYNLDSNSGEMGDAFMQMIQPIAAYVPYMTSVGNHESAHNFTHYKQRFSMPGGTESIFYSYNVGRAHIISMSTEVYYYTKYGTEQITTQLNWLKEDLAKANMPENRERYPWIIVLGHRPMYCAAKDNDDCVFIKDLVRLSVEPLFYEQGVDLLIWAHEHNYQRMFPLYNYQMCNGSKENPYKNPRGITHIITGSAGCQEKHNGFFPKPAYVAKNSLDYGYTKMKVMNSTHLFMEQISDDQGGAVVDSVMIQVDKHGPGLYTCLNDKK